MENQIRLLSTKKLLESQKQLLLSANFAIEEADFINVVNRHFEIKIINDFLIFTSQNAVESVLENVLENVVKNELIVKTNSDEVETTKIIVLK